jgi:excisionase family DNA binding protein
MYPPIVSSLSTAKDIAATSLTSSHQRFLTVVMAAAELAVSTQTVRKLIRLGRLRAVRIGRAIRIERSSLEDFLVDRST